ncbi:hypothetical protein MKW94_018859 [Papaver nudicaule]|uniref:RING-type E3 ubiquitin transferase n=1 Tax=Papaver nudicaule TaxID=74823 RepID=A0AA41UXX8_PAPNU|nr:hypothetical protein [Papaver nudicaule]
MSFLRQQRGGGRMYFCHQCERTISITPSSDLVCPNCNGEFIEEIENQNPNPNPNPFFSISETTHPLGGGGRGGGGFPSLTNALAGMPLFSSSSSSPNSEFQLQSPMDLFTMFEQATNPTQTQNQTRSSSAAAQTGGSDPDIFNPLMFIQQYLNTVNGGGSIQFIIENNPMDVEFGIGGGGGGGRMNLGDYFLGPGLEQLIQQLAENDPNRYGTPPAAKTAIEKLPDVNITEDILASEFSQCAVCKDEFELGSVTKQMPCKHIYHPDCILPWLELHNSCPVCRHELPTDDPDYEQRSREAAENPPRGGGGTGSGDAVPNTPRTAERRVRISLPFLFGQSPETSGSNNNNDGNRNSGGNRDSGPQENLNFVALTARVGCHASLLMLGKFGNRFSSGSSGTQSASLYSSNHSPASFL